VLGDYMDKLLNSSFYLHLEKGPELAKRYNYSMDYLLGKIDENNKI